MTHAKQNALLQRRAYNDRKSGRAAARRRRVLALVRKYSLSK